MAFQTFSANPPLADPPQIQWGAHFPPLSADPQDRLQHAIIDLLLSNTIETATHSSGPYFTDEIFKLCLVTRFESTANIHSILTAYGLLFTNASKVHFINFSINIDRVNLQMDSSKIPSYRVGAVMQAFDSSNNLVAAPTIQNRDNVLGATIEFFWSAESVSGGRSPELNWESIVAILRTVALCGATRMKVELQKL